MRYAAVHVNKPLETPYTYRIPARLKDAVAPGSRVEVSLGRGRAMGVVVALTDELPEGLPEARVKPLLRVLEMPAALDSGLLSLGAQMAEYYLCAPGEAYHAMVPSYSLPQPSPRFRLTGDASEILAALSPRASKQRLLVEAIAGASRGMTRAKLVRVGGASALEALVTKGHLEKLGREVAALTPPSQTPGDPPGVFPELRDRQRQAYAAIVEDLDAGRHRTHLLHGVTGSGKTEVYLAAIREALARGRTCLFLIPEIALTVAMIEKVRERLGPLLAVLHSRMGGKERYREWARARTGEARVVLGPRSAVFAPLPDLGLVILDEEQENSYKQQDKPRYHAREVAIWRGQAGGFPVILGSATPSLESFRAGQVGEYLVHRLPQRFRQGDSLPPVTLVDMADEFREKRNKSVFSGPLKDRLDATLARGGQGLLFMNRRGYHTYVFCRTCGYVLECRDCSVALTFHLERHDCLCHHCGFRTAAPRRCPACQSQAIRYAGTGTQRVAREFALNFPEVRFARMDSDTTRGKGAHEAILGDYAAGRTKVLIGTQMLAKGFDFPRLHFVGVVNADGGLTMPDFRGAEKTFQLLTQVAGRCGRGDERGEVVVQTYRPDHYALQAAKDHDYEAFAARELPLREELFYPPYSRLVLVSSEATTEEKAASTLDALRDHLAEVVTGAGRLRLMGPAPAPLQRIERRHRWQLLIKLERHDEALAALRAGLVGFPGGLTELKVDVDPMNLL